MVLEVGVFHDTLTNRIMVNCYPLHGEAVTSFR